MPRLSAVGLGLSAVLILGACTQSEPFSLPTHCGISIFEYEGVIYERVGGPLTDGQGNPPDGWENPTQEGRLMEDKGTLVFTDDAGHRELFTQAPDQRRAVLSECD